MTLIVYCFRVAGKVGFEPTTFGFGGHCTANCATYPYTWSGKRGSNSRHLRWQRSALPLSYSRKIIGGDKRDRTVDLLHAMQALSQLSYIPNILSGGGDGIRTHGLFVANEALYQLSYTPKNCCRPSPLPRFTTVERLASKCCAFYRLFGGPYRSRTGHLLHAMQAFCQMN